MSCQSVSNDQHTPDEIRQCSGPAVSVTDARDPREALGLCVAVSGAVGAALDVPAFCLFRPSRGIGRVAFARQVAMYVAHVELRVSMQRVGEAFGRNRSTVAHACRRIEDLRDEQELDKLIAQAVATVETLVAQHGSVPTDGQRRCTSRGSRP